jgi:carboxypeptidase Q
MTVLAKPYILMKLYYLALILLVLASCRSTRKDDAAVIEKIYSEALSDSTAFHNLRTLCTHYPGRICGTSQAAAAVEWSKEMLETMGLDTVWLQPVKVKRWDRGEPEVARVTSNRIGEHSLSVCAAGWSVGTGPDGLSSKVVMVSSRDELKALGEKGIRGKIVFFNQAMDPTHYYTFNSYGEAVWQRAVGASEAARFGAKAVLIRSLTEALDDYPHTGIMHYADSLSHIPALAVSTLGADSLADWLQSDPNLSLYVRNTSVELPETGSFNVIGEIRGTEKPGEIIAFGGHLDAWDITQGAHDDGAGVIQTMEVLRLFKKLEIKPKHTIRIVVFMDEEVAQRGAAAYAEYVKASHEKHIAAIETDRGAFTPYGFSIDAPVQVLGEIERWRDLLKPYGIWSFERGGSGVDIRDLKPLGVPLLALITDSQRYFDYQHAATDTWRKVHPRELQLGSATIAAIVYLIDNYGI